MRQIPKLLVVGLLVVGMAACRRPLKEEREGAPLGKCVVITDTTLCSMATDTLRLGRMRRGEQLSFRFHLQNQTEKPQVILGHEITCGCIDLHYENKPIMPMQYHPVEMRFDSRGLNGWQLKLFRLQLLGAETPFTLFVEAEVE